MIPSASQALVRLADRKSESEIERSFHERVEFYFHRPIIGLEGNDSHLSPSIGFAGRTMIIVRLSLLASMFACLPARGEEWKRWPEKADEFATTVLVPTGFTLIRTQPPVLGKGAGDASLLLDARFRSPDRKVELAVAVFHVRGASTKPEMRRIAVRLAPGEKVIDSQSSRKKATGEHGDYWIYEEETTVRGSGYTRYLRHSFSTGSLPGASSIVWEFRAADESARINYAAAYRRFRDSLEIEAD